MPRQSTVIGFWKCCFVLIHSQVCCGSVLWMRCSCSWGETSDIILLNESLRFIQNVASCYALCLTKESVNTATLVHAPACVCVCLCLCVCVCVCACVHVRVCVPRTEVWVIRVHLKYEVEAGPDLIPSRSGVRTLRSAGLYRYQHVEVDLSLFVSESICGVRCRKLRHYSIIPFLLSLSIYSELTALKTPKRTTSMQMSFPETVSDSLCRNDLVMQTDCCSSCPGGWSQTILEVKMLDVEVLGWCGYTWSAVVSPVGCTAKFSETPLEMAYGREINIQFTNNSSGGHSCSQHANCTLPQNLRHLWHCAVW